MTTRYGRRAWTCLRTAPSAYADQGVDTVTRLRLYYGHASLTHTRAKRHVATWCDAPKELVA